MTLSSPLASEPRAADLDIGDYVHDIEDRAIRCAYWVLERAICMSLKRNLARRKKGEEGKTVEKCGLPPKVSS